jgi:hypothetical protein
MRVSGVSISNANKYSPKARELEQAPGFIFFKVLIQFEFTFCEQKIVIVKMLVAGGDKVTI